MSAPALPGSWSGAIVICAANRWEVAQFADRRLAESLAAHVPVVYVDPPMSVLTPLRRPEARRALEGPRLRAAGPNLARLTPVVLPGPQRPGMSVLTGAIARRALRHAVRALGGEVRAVVDANPLTGMTGVSGERTMVFWAQDDFTANAEHTGVSPDRVRRAETRMACGADVVVAANPIVEERWRRRGLRTALIPFGCDHELFTHADDLPAPPGIRLPAPIAGFAGGLTAHRVDVRLLEAVADRGLSLLLVGPRDRRAPLPGLDRLLERPNVQWVGERPFEEMPSWLGAVDVGLVPYLDTAFNRGSFPLKTLEYLAAGRAVVATDLPAIRWLDTDLVEIAGEPDAYAGAVARALAQPRTPASVSRRRAFAATHSWSVRAGAWLDLLPPLTGEHRSPASGAGGGTPAGAS
ncbi:MAG TPA: glycosyltransferase [Candidatus Dormibacteraeota bacterium]|nr:glycosyltransferase [Candidatus Dormibacteraeota bacterium]